MCNLYVVHGLSCSLARLSSRLTEVRWGVLFVLLSHSLHLMTLGENFAGFTHCRKQFLDFKRLSAEICPCKEWASFVSCLAFSTLAHTSRLMLGGVIPDKYNSSTLVGSRHPVIINSCFHFYERGLLSCATQIVCIYEATCSVVESLVISVYVENDGGQDTSLWQVVLPISPSAKLIVQFHIEPPTGQHVLDYST